MDMQMPKASGAEAIATILADDPAARIIVLSTYAGDASATRALKMGAAGYLLKSNARKVPSTPHIASAYRERIKLLKS
ncbi:hypothetical protein NRB_44470 [Novosphingobium sp. 11B]